ncbi:MAG: DUF6491 family protein [Povalibacter sp.]
MKTAFLVACAIASIGLAQAASVKNTDPIPGASKDACVFISNIQNWRVLDSRNVVIYAPNAKRAYLMQLGSPISDLKFTFRVAFLDNDRDGQLCGRSPDRVVATDSIVRQPTLISGMTRLDDAGFEALEAKYNVKLTTKKAPKEATQPEPAPAQQSGSSAIS